MKQATDIDALDMLIHNSLKYYCDIKALLNDLKHELEINSADRIQQLVVEFTEIKKKSQITDNLLLSEVDEAQVSSNTAEMLEQLRIVQTDILVLIQQTIPRANTVKSFLANEILAIKNGRNAMTGYRSKSGKQGRIVNKIS